MMVSPEALHPGPVRPKRGKVEVSPEAAKPRRKHTNGVMSDDALTALYTWFTGNGRDLTGAPEGLVVAARGYIGKRIAALAELRKRILTKGGRTGRIRTQLRWLRRWRRMLTPVTEGDP